MKVGNHEEKIVLKLVEGFTIYTHEKKSRDIGRCVNFFFAVFRALGAPPHMRLGLPSEFACESGCQECDPENKYLCLPMLF